MKNIAIVSLLSVGALFCQSAAADTNAGWYLGGALGRATVKDTADTGHLVSFNRDSSNVGAKFFGGYRLNPYLGLEAAYSHFGKEKYSYTDTGLTGAGELKAEAFSLAATGRLPINDVFAATGKIGVARVHSHYHESWVDSGTPGSDSDSQNSMVPMLGLGAEYTLNKSLSIRAEYEAYGKAKIVDSSYVGAAKVKTALLSVGVAYHF